MHSLRWQRSDLHAPPMAGGGIVRAGRIQRGIAGPYIPFCAQRVCSGWVMFRGRRFSQDGHRVLLRAALVDKSCVV